MANELELFFSNRLEVLYQQLKCSLFGSRTTPLMRRLVVVYGPVMKTWLMQRMAQDPDLKVATGIEFLYLNQAFETLLKLITNEQVKHLPTFLELALVIEKELMAIIQSFHELSVQEQEDWSPVIHYFKLMPQAFNFKVQLSKKMEKRVISLSQHLARLFQEYGRFAPQMTNRWELPQCRGWQQHLWRQIFGEKMGWTYPSKILSLSGKGICAKKGEAAAPGSSISLCSIHFFSISFVTDCEFDFLERLSSYAPIHYYLLSPCAVYWSDIRSDRENAYLHTHWQRKLGAFSPRVMNLEELLRDRNPLLANFGRMGRQMATQIEESFATTHAHYVLPAYVNRLGEELLLQDDLYLTEKEGSLSLLHAIQADLLLMRNPQQIPPIELDDSRSIQLHIAPNKRREVQVLYNNLLDVIEKNPTLSPGDMIVMAPQINDYVPYIQSIFGSDESLLDFQVLDLGMHTQSEIAQGFLQLLTLSESRWNAGNLLQLFEHASFQRRHQLTPGDYATIQDWIEQTGIRWGDDWVHRNELLRRSHCEKGMVEETAVGTWDYGLSRLLFGLTTVIDTQIPDHLDVLPHSTIEFSQSELMGRWMHLLHSLRDDLSPLEDSTRMTMEDWVNFLMCLLDSYFQPDFDHAKSIEEYDELKEQFEILRGSVRYFKETSYPFATVKAHLLLLLQQHEMTYREDHLQAVRFCSLVPLRSIPAKLTALLGMQEGAFPRPAPHSSLNLMTGSKEIGYSPMATDYDRYLFLEAVHSAQDYLLLSYQGYSQRESKEVQPSLIIEELVSYLDKYYTINGKKFSELCVFKHPFDPFDERYFVPEKNLPNYSSRDFNAARIHNKCKKNASHSFLNEFICVEHPKPRVIENNSLIDIRHLSAAARNPIKFHLNKILEIYIETEEDRQLKTEEELVISSLDRHQMKQYALKESIDSVLHKAEREGKLPFGLFKHVAIQRIKEEVEEIRECLKKHAINPAHLFQIEFCTSCLEPTQIAEDRWLFPPAQLRYEDGYQLSIGGKLSHVSSKGLVSLSKGSLADVWKVWPQFLLYCHAAKLCPDKLDPQLILAQSAQPKKAFFDDPEEHLKRFIHYYALCLQNFSPLLPDWIPMILAEDVRGLQDKMRSVFNDSFGNYQHHDLRWILNKQRLPQSATMIHYWKSEAERLLTDIIHHWFNKAGKSV